MGGLDFDHAMIRMPFVLWIEQGRCHLNTCLLAQCTITKQLVQFDSLILLGIANPSWLNAAAWNVMPRFPEPRTAFERSCRMKRTRSSIRDGYTRRAFIYSDGNHDGLEFQYRPMLPDAVDELIAKTKKEVLSRPKDRIQIIAATIAPHITEWSEAGVDDAMLPITPDAVARLPWPLLSRVEAIVTGFSYSDLAPDATPDELERFERAKAGSRKWPGVEEATEDKKN